MFRCSMFHVPCSMKQRGVTLVELVVVLSVFMFIIGITTTIFLSIFSQQKRILQAGEALNQSSFAMEYISRAARMSIADTAGTCLVDGNMVAYPGGFYLLTHYDSASGFYRGVKLLANDAICQEFFMDQDGVLKEIKNGGVAQNLLSGRFTLAYMQFIINGDKNLVSASENDSIQPRLSMVVKLQLQNDGILKDKVLQTSVSQINVSAP